MSLATVYKTITLLKQAGEVLELQFSDLGNRYDGRRPTPHPHVICTACGAIVDADDPLLCDAAERVARETGYDILTPAWIFSACAQPAAKKGLRPTLRKRPDAQTSRTYSMIRGEEKSLGECRKKRRFSRSAGRRPPSCFGAALVEGRGEGPGVIRQAEGVGQKALCGIGPG